MGVGPKVAGSGIEFGKARTWASSDPTAARLDQRGGKCFQSCHVRTTGLSGSPRTQCMSPSENKARKRKDVHDSPQTDRLAILRSCTRDGRLSNANIAKRCVSALTTCHRRLRRLVAEGHLAGVNRGGQIRPPSASGRWWWWGSWLEPDRPPNSFAGVRGGVVEMEGGCWTVSSYARRIRLLSSRSRPRHWPISTRCTARCLIALPCVRQSALLCAQGTLRKRACWRLLRPGSGCSAGGRAHPVGCVGRRVVRRGRRPAQSSPAIRKVSKQRPVGRALAGSGPLKQHRRPAARRRRRSTRCRSRCCRHPRPPAPRRFPARLLRHVQVTPLSPSALSRP